VGNVEKEGEGGPFGFKNCENRIHDVDYGGRIGHWRTGFKEDGQGLRGQLGFPR